jgi:hypothetical protein
MTRVAAERLHMVTALNARWRRVRELDEMTIGRTEDAENPRDSTVVNAAALFRTGSRTTCSPAITAPRRKGSDMTAIDPPVRFLDFALASMGPVTHESAQISQIDTAPH